MNSKLMKASLAGAAAIALAAGGGTFAAWSDFGQFGNSVGAGILRLQLNPNSQNPGDDLRFDNVTMAPGSIYQERQVYVASSDGQSVPNSRLYVSLKDLVGQENGCDSNSEAFDESSGAISDRNDSSAPCNDTSGAGQLIDQATLSISSYLPNSSGACNYSYGASGTVVTANQGWTLAQWAAHNHHEVTGANDSTNPAVFTDLPTLAPGQGVCVALVLALPSTTTAGISQGNAAQGDKADFKIRFDLEQA